MSMMIFGTLFFLGLFIMFVFILFGQEKVVKTVRKEMEEQRAYMALLEQRLEGLEAAQMASLQLTDQMAGHMAGQVSGHTGASAYASSGNIDLSGVAAMSQQMPDMRHTHAAAGRGAAHERVSSAPQRGQMKPVGAKDKDMELFMAPPHR